MMNLTFNEYLANCVIVEDFLNEGGASGHMSHLYDELDLSFNELKNIIRDVLSGKIELSEKSDGQQIAITFKDGQLMAARNKTTLQDPMSIDEVASKFAGRGAIKDAFVNSMKDIQSAILSLSEKERQEIFNNGHNYMSCEIIYPPTKNVINYGNRALIQFHGVMIYDAKWKKIGEDKSLATQLYNLLKDKNALNQEVFEITGPTILKLNKDFTKDIPRFIKDLSKIQGSIKDNQTIKDWITYNWMEYLESELEYRDFYDIDKTFIISLINRWAFNDKSYSKNNLIKDISKILDEKKIKDFEEWFNKMDTEAGNFNKNILKPLELFTINLGGQLLNNLSGFITTSPDVTVSDLKKDLEDAINTINKSDIPSAINKLNYNLEKIEAVGYDKIAPTEGVVLLYKGKPIKMTGVFGAVNQLIGLFKYGRA